MGLRYCEKKEIPFDNLVLICGMDELTEFGRDCLLENDCPADDQCNPQFCPLCEYTGMKRWELWHNEAEYCIIIKEVVDQ